MNLTKQIGRVYWLKQQSEMMSLQTWLSKQMMRASLPGEEKDPAIGTTRFYLNGEFDARQLRHDDIANQKIRTIDLDIRQGLQRVREKSNRIAITLQNHCKRLCDEQFIINNENDGYISFFHPICARYSGLQAGEG